MLIGDPQVGGGFLVQPFLRGLAQLIKKINATTRYTRLCFGIRHAVRAFQALAELIVLMLKDQSIIEKYDHLIVFVMAYIDDYCAVTKTKQGGHLFLTSWKNLMRELGLPWDPAKTEVPAKESHYHA